MESNPRKVMSEHNARRMMLSTPSRLSVPITPPLFVSKSELASKSATKASEPQLRQRLGKEKERRPSPPKRTLSKPLVLSESSDSEDGGFHSRRGRNSASARAAPPTGRQSVRSQRSIDRDKFRQVLRDEEDDDLGPPAWLTVSNMRTESCSAVVAGNRAVQHTVGAMQSKIMEDLDQASSAEMTSVSPRRRGAGTSITAPPVGPQKSPRQPKEHRDALRSRGTSFPVSRALCAQCYDVGGFLCVAPSNLTATTNLREFRGKIVLMGLGDLVHAGRFSSAGACALVVTAKHPEEAALRYKCNKDTRLPVVFISEVGAKGLENGSLVKVLFDVASQSPSAPKSKLSKNAQHRRVLGSGDVPHVDKSVTSPNANRLTEVSDDSGIDSDGDAEFCLVRRRRQIRGSTPGSARPNSGNHVSPATAVRAAQAGPAQIAVAAVTDMASDDDSSISARFKMRHRSDAPIREPASAASPHQGFASGEASLVRTVEDVVENMMGGNVNEMLRRVLHLSVSNKQSTHPNTELPTDQIVAALANRLHQMLCSEMNGRRLEGITRLRELCRSKSQSLAADVVNVLFCLPNSADALWDILGGMRGEDSQSWLPAQLAAAVCLRHVALEQKNVHRLVNSSKSTEILGKVLNIGTDEGLRQKVAALIANLTVEQDTVRDLLCAQELVLRGLCQLLFTSNSKAMDSSLAALSNLSLDSRQTGLIFKELNMVGIEKADSAERIVMILLSGGTKARHRGAGLIRNLLFSPRTREAVAQVDTREQVPGMMKALQKLQKSMDGETQQRASIALDMLVEYQQEQGGEDVSMLERKLMDTGDKKVPAQRTPAPALGASPFTFTLPESLEHQVNEVDLVTHAGPAGSRASNGILQGITGDKIASAPVNCSSNPLGSKESDGTPLVVNSAERSSLDAFPKVAKVAEQNVGEKHRNTTLFSSTLAPSTPLPDEGSIETQFQSLEMSKIDLFSPETQPVASPMPFPASASSGRALPANNQTATSNAASAHLAPRTQGRLLGIPAPSTPPQHPGSRMRTDKNERKSSDEWKIERIFDSPAALVARLLTSQDLADMLDAVQSLCALLQEGANCQAAQGIIGADSRLFPLIARLLTDDPRRMHWQNGNHQRYDMDNQVLRLLRDVCRGHAKNVRQLCSHESALSAVLKISLDVGAKEASKEAAVAAEIVSYCILDDGNWEKLTAVRSRVKKVLATSTRHVPLTRSIGESHANQPMECNDSSTSARRHSANYLARQQVAMVYEWSA